MSDIFPLNRDSKERNQTTVFQLYQRNKHNRSSHRRIRTWRIRTFVEIAQSEDAPPPILLLTCADIRCLPEQFFHLNRGEVVTIKSIGGRIEQQLSGILAADWLFHFKEFVIVHHTDCGATHFTTEGLRSLMRERAPGDTGIEDLKFGDMTNLEESVRHDLKIFQESPYVRTEWRDNSYGFVYDMKTGDLSPVATAAANLAKERSSL